MAKLFPDVVTTKIGSSLVTPGITASTKNPQPSGKEKRKKKKEGEWNEFGTDMRNKVREEGWNQAGWRKRNKEFRQGENQEGLKPGKKEDIRNKGWKGLIKDGKKDWRIKLCPGGSAEVGKEERLLDREERMKSGRTDRHAGTTEVMKEGKVKGR